MPPTSPFLRCALVAAFLTPALGGCGSFYLHSDAAKEATARAQTEIDKVSLTAVFDNETAYLNELEKRENAAVADSLAAQRDAELLDMLQGLDEEDSDGRTLMVESIDQYLQAVAGTSDRGGETKLWQLIDQAHNLAGSKKTFAETLAATLSTKRSLVKAPAGASIATVPSPAGITLDRALKDAQDAMDDLQKKQSAAKKARDELNEQLAQAEKSLAAGTATQQTFTDLLTKVTGFLTQAKGTATSNPYIAKYVSESLLERLDELIKVTDPKGIDQPQDTKARATIGFVHAAFGVGDAFAKPPRVPHPNALAATKAWLQYEASDADLQVALATSKVTVKQAILAAVGEQVYYLSRAGDALKPIATKPPLERSEGLAKLIADKKPATSRAASAGLNDYASAWTKGFIPAQQLTEVTEPLIDRRGKLQASRKSGEAWLGTLKPAVATLAAYGEGGFDPHVLAELLQTLGIGAIASGVN